MGYLINSEFISKKIIIPEADVQILDSTPYVILDYSGDGLIQVLSCAVTPNSNQATTYLGFGHLYLRDQPTSLAKIAIYDEAIAGLELNYLSSLIINMNHPPNTFGSQKKLGNGLALQFQTPITQGDGDLIVFIQYRILYI